MLLQNVKWLQKLLQSCLEFMNVQILLMLKIHEFWHMLKLTAHESALCTIAIEPYIVINSLTKYIG